MPDFAKLTAACSIFALLCGIAYNYTYFSIIDGKVVSLLSLHDHINSAIPIIFAIIPMVIINFSLVKIQSILEIKTFMLLAIYLIPIIGKKYKQKLEDHYQELRQKEQSQKRLLEKLDQIKKDDGDEQSDLAVDLSWKPSSYVGVMIWTNKPRIAIFIMFFVLITISVIWSINLSIAKFIALLLSMLVYHMVIQYMPEYLLDKSQEKVRVLVEILLPGIFSMTMCYAIVNAEILYYSPRYDIKITGVDNSQINAAFIKAIDGGILIFNPENRKVSYYPWSQIKHFDGQSATSHL